MKRAIALARRGAGCVEPNPMVGCVIVRDGRIIGEGWHRRFGRPHAEVNALAQAGPRARGATVYVTLEPCAHTGKTPPCADAIIAAGAKRVVIGAADPNPPAGGGARRLRDAGLDVEFGVMEAEARELIAPFAKRITTGLPFVIAKWAATLDGAIATRDGDSRWISSDASRRDVHRLRGRVDAIMVGIGTALADDPLLTARGVTPRRIARRVVIDPNLRVGVGSKLVESVGLAPLSVAATPAALRAQAVKRERLAERGVELIALRGRRRRDGTRPLADLLRALADLHDATNVLVEGGAGLIGSLHRERLIDRFHVYIGAKVLGEGGLAATAGPGQGRRSARMGDATRLQLLDLRRLGDDVRAIYRPHILS